MRIKISDKGAVSVTQLKYVTLLVVFYTWHDGFLALMALGGVLIGVALCAEELFILGGEGLVNQGALALETLEAFLVPMAVLVGQILDNSTEADGENFDDNYYSIQKLTQKACWAYCVIVCGIAYPGVTANGLLALLTGVGVQTLVTLHTVGILLSQNILLPKQGLLAVVAVVALSHFDPGGLLREGERQQDSESEKSRKGRERTLLNESGFMQISHHATTFFVWLKKMFHI